ncbi:MAG: hypothetical protein AAGF81_20850 [Pseudomonadota bacterium]
MSLMVLLAGAGIHQAMAAENGKLEHASLRVMLENLGYEPEERKFTDGLAYYDIEEPGDVRMTAKVFVSASGNILWFLVDYWALKEDQKYPHEVLLELLAENDKAAYVHFGYLPKSRRMRLNASLVNRGIKPVDLRRVINEASRLTDRTQHLWNPNEWKVQPAKAAAPAEEKAGENPQ